MIIRFGLASVIALTLLCPSVASAQDVSGIGADAVASGDPAAMSGEEALALDAKAYSERYGASLVEPMRRIRIMAGTGEQIAAIKNELGGNLSGAYFNNHATFELAMKTTGAQAR